MASHSQTAPLPFSTPPRPRGPNRQPLPNPDQRHFHSSPRLASSNPLRSPCPAPAPSARPRLLLHLNHLLSTLGFQSNATSALIPLAVMATHAAADLDLGACMFQSCSPRLCLKEKAVVDRRGVGGAIRLVVAQHAHPDL